MIREFQKSDIPELLTIFTVNCPKYFAEHEISDFENFLSLEDKYYFVKVQEGKVVGAGGFHFADETTGRLSWYLFSPQVQGKGYGKELVEYNISMLKKIRPVKRILVYTSQLTDGFYNKFGFITFETQKDYWAPGLDLYKMEMVIS